MKNVLTIEYIITNGEKSGCDLERYKFINYIINLDCARSCRVQHGNHNKLGYLFRVFIYSNYSDNEARSF